MSVFVYLTARWLGWLRASIVTTNLTVLCTWHSPGLVRLSGWSCELLRLVKNFGILNGGGAWQGVEECRRLFHRSLEVLARVSRVGTFEAVYYCVLVLGGG